MGALAFRDRYLLALGKRSRCLNLALQENGRPCCQKHDKQEEGENPAQEAHNRPGWASFAADALAMPSRDGAGRL